MVREVLAMCMSGCLIVNGLSLCKDDFIFLGECTKDII